MRAELYTDELTRDLSPYITSITTTHSTTAPYMSAQLSLAAEARRAEPYLERVATGAADLDGWVLITSQDTAAPLIMGPIIAISESLEALEGGVLRRALTLTISSPLHYMTTSTLAISAKSTGAAGVYDLSEWAPKMRRLIQAPFSSYQVGEVLRRTFNELARPYRLPLTLGGQSLNSLPIIYNTARAEQYAPERAPDLRGVHGLAVQLISASALPTSTPWGLITGAFDVEPALIELFLTIEPHINGPLSQRIGGTPSIIYRLKPWVSGRINSAAGLEIEAINESTRAAAQTPHRLSADQILNYQARLSDSDRANVIYLDGPFTASQGVESFGLLISPRVDRADTNRAGSRVFKARWPFFPPRTRQEALKPHLNYMLDTAAAIIGEGHRYASASASTAYRPDIRAGLWVALDLSDFRRALGYVQSVSHTLNVSPEGTITRRTTLELVRVHYEEAP